jgi:vanillate O-demethylase ferredoxin subunit
VGELTVTVARARRGGRRAVVRSFARATAGVAAVRAGSHVDVHVAPGIVRQYCCAAIRASPMLPDRGEARSHIAGGSVAMHERVSEGASLVVGAPRNNFALVLGASHHLLIAGGIGITPILRWRGTCWRRARRSSSSTSAGRSRTRRSTHCCPAPSSPAA